MEIRYWRWAALIVGLVLSGSVQADVPDLPPPIPNPFFSFLPPIASTTTRGVFDGSLLPDLAVEICEVRGSFCAPGPPMARFTSDSPGSERLRLAGRHYQVQWHAREPFSAGRRYRIGVVAAGTRLGEVDVDVVRRVTERRQVLTIMEGQTLPIRFRVERGAISIVGADGAGTVNAGGGTVTTPDGRVRLLFRPESVSAATTITITGGTGFPSAPGFVVPQSVFEFGPSGIVFGRAVHLTIAYDPATLPAAVPESDLRLQKVVNGVWQEIPGSLVDPNANSVSGWIDGFSVYGVVSRVGTQPGPTLSGLGTAVVDGSIGASEWTFAGRFDFLMNYPDGTEGFGAVSVMNDATTLYVMVRFDRGVLDPGNELEITFDGNDNGTTVSGDDNLRFVVGGTPAFTDEHWTNLCTAPATFCTRHDTAFGAGGTSEGQGAFTHNGTVAVYEVAHPLKSADTTHDIGVVAAQRLGFRIAVRLTDASSQTATTFVPHANGYAHILVQPAHVPMLGGFGTPAVDGTVDQSEWSGASCLVTPIAVPGNATVPGQFCVMNDLSNLYVSLKFPRAAGNEGNSLGIEFDNDNDGVMEEGDDGMVHNPAVGFSDNFRTMLPPCQPGVVCGLQDTQTGGTSDGYGAFANDGIHSSYELAHPLNSGDAGHDFALSAGDRVGVSFFSRIIRPPGVFPVDFGDTQFPDAPRYAEVCIAGTGGTGTECAITSKYLRNDPCVTPILNGTPYDMNDPAWLTTSHDQNPNTCAYKFFSALHMLGYNTFRANGLSDHQIQVLNVFQAQYGFTVGNMLTLDVLLQLDALLAVREAKIAPVAGTFLLYNNMQPLLKNQVSRDWVAHIYKLAMKVLPASLQMGLYEEVQCINGQCQGFIHDPSGNPFPTWPISLTQPYRFVGGYFDPFRTTASMPSAAVHVETVLHEYAHYLDDGWPVTVNQPLRGIIATASFDAISFDMTTINAAGCVARLSNDPRDFISRYGFLSNYGCPAGTYQHMEEFAEAFQIYVTAGKNFRAAAAQNATIAQKYNWLKTNVFQGIEYDTDLQQGLYSGCNDVPGYHLQQPGYVSCSESYVWDGELRVK